jgi:vitamin B12 transporter
MLLKKALPVVFILLFTVFTANLMAQDGDLYAQNESSAVGSFGSLDMVVVTADRSKETLRDVSQSMDIISGDELRDSGAINAVDYLKRLGFQVAQSRGPNYGDETIRIRGFSTSSSGNDVNTDILVLIDGRRAGSDSISFQSVNMVDRIEIIRGPGAVQYGAAAMGGVLNFITKRGTKDLKVRAEAGLGSDDNYKASVSVAGMSGKFEFSGGSSYSTGGDYSDGHGIVNPYSAFDYKINNVANFGYNIDDYNHINLTGFYTLQKDMGGGRSNYYIQWQDMTNYSFDLSYEGSTASGDKSWLARYFRGYSQQVLAREPNNPAIRPGGVFDASETENTFNGAQAHVRWEPSILSFIAGVDWLNYHFIQSQLYHSNVSSPPAPAATGDSTHVDIGTFLMAKAYLLENRNLVLSAGMRYDIYNLDVDNVMQSSPIFPELKTSAEKKYTNFIPSFGIAYSPLEFLKVRSNYSQAFKLPTPRHLAGNFYMGATPYYGDINIEPEEAVTWDVGFDLAWDRTVEVSMSYFSSVYSNYITSYTVAAGSLRPDGVSTYPERGSQYYNTPEAKISGLELDSRYNVGRYFDWEVDLTPYFNFTYLYRYKNEAGKYLPGIAKKSASFGFDLYYDDIDLKFSLAGSYYGKITVATSLTSQSAPTRKAGATVWDASIMKSLYDFNDSNSLKVKVTVNNLFNKYYDTSNGDYMPGRTFYIGLVYEKD